MRTSTTASPPAAEMREVAELRPHPQACELPQLDAGDLATFKQDMFERGLQVPLETALKGEGLLNMFPREGRVRDDSVLESQPYGGATVKVESTQSTNAEHVRRALGKPEILQSTCARRVEKSGFRVVS